LPIAGKIGARAMALVAHVGIPHYVVLKTDMATLNASATVGSRGVVTDVGLLSSMDQQRHGL
jgi:hypothetical protein